MDLACDIRSSILGCDDLPSKPVDLPLWGPNGMFFVRSLTGDERDAFDERIMANTGADKKVNQRRLKAAIVALTLVNVTGDRIFSDDDVERLAAKSAAMLNTAADVALKVNGLTKADVEDLAKNSESPPTSDSGSN